jgi:hypothetical protein
MHEYADEAVRPTLKTGATWQILNKSRVNWILTPEGLRAFSTVLAAGARTNSIFQILKSDLLTPRQHMCGVEFALQLASALSGLKCSWISTFPDRVTAVMGVELRVCTKTIRRLTIAHCEMNLSSNERCKIIELACCKCKRKNRTHHHRHTTCNTVARRSVGHLSERPTGLSPSMRLEVVPPRGMSSQDPD